MAEIRAKALGYIRDGRGCLDVLGLHHHLRPRRRRRPRHRLAERRIQARQEEHITETPTKGHSMNPTREETITGLRQLADLLEQHPGFRVPRMHLGEVVEGPIRLFPQADELPTIVAALGRPLTLTVPDDGDHVVRVGWQVGGVGIEALISVQRLCKEKTEVARYMKRGEMHVVYDWAIPDYLQPAPVETPAEVA